MADENVQAAAAADNTASATAEEPVLTAQAEGAAEKSDAPETAAAKTAGAEAPEEEAILDVEKSKEGTEGAEKENPLTGAPESYEDFSMPEGWALEGEQAEQAEEVKGIFKELNLSQAGSQKLVDYFVKRVADGKEAELEALATRRKEWRAQIRATPNFAEDRAMAGKGLAAVVTTPEEKKLFQDSWMQDHPAVFSIFAKVGRLLAEDGGVPRGSGQPAPDSNAARFPVKM